MQVTLGAPRLAMELRRPLVYLDQWAISDLAKSQVLQDRFLRCLDRGATLALSFTGASELLRAAPGHGVDAIQRFFRNVGLAYCLLDNRPWDILKRAHDAGSTEIEAALDHEWANEVAKAVGIAPAGATLESVLVWSRSARDSVLPDLDDLARRIVVEVEQVRGQPTPKPLGRGCAPTASPIEWYWTGLVRKVLSNPFPMNTHHALDLVHAVIAAGVCDFVLLDGHWVELLRQVGPGVHPRRVYSARDEGLEAFVHDLESAVANGPSGSTSST